MSAVFWKKFNNPLKENLDDDYPNVDEYDKNVSKELNHVGVKVIHAFKTHNGLKLKATANRNPNGALVGTLEPEFKISAWNVTVSGKFATDRKYESTVSVNDLGQKGTKLYLKDIVKQGEPSFEGGFELKHSDFTIDGKVSKPLEGGDYKGSVAGVLHQSGYYIGGEVEYINNKGVSRWNIKVLQEKHDGALCFFTNVIKIPEKPSDNTDIGISYTTHLGHHLKGAVETKVNQKRETTVRFGVDYQVDESTNLKSKVTVKEKREMRLGLLYKQKVTSYSKFYASADLNVGQLIGSSNPSHLFSATFSYGDD